MYNIDMIDYKYQDVAVKEVLRNALNPRYVASVLAAAPGAGKSIITAKLLNSYFKQCGQDKSVLILTHNQTILKEQMIEYFKSGPVKPDYTFGDSSNYQVHITIPSAFNFNSTKQYDMIVIDEAHQYYFESMVDSIIDIAKPKHQILLTGSPSYFIRYNKFASRANEPEFALHFITPRELLDMGVFSSVNMDVFKVQNIDVSEKFFKEIFRQAKHKRYNLSKIMIATASVEQARLAHTSLLALGFKASISTSADDSDNSEIARFKSGESNVLIVVNKGILGFSDPNITCLIDLKKSKNLDNRNQLFSRLLRKHPKDIDKCYISVAKASSYNNEVNMLYALKSLFNDLTFKTYDGVKNAC